MQPYQEASQEMIRQGENPVKALKTIGGALGTAAGFGAGAAVAKRVLPFLSPYISESLAIKGLSKIDPRFGAFIKLAKDHGTSFDEIKNFIKTKATEEEPEKTEPAKENRNIIEQYSPELHKFIDEEIKKGRPVLEAGALAQLDDKFKNAIKKISEDHKTDWSSILQSVYGTSEKVKPSPAVTQQPQPPQGRQPFQGPGIHQQPPKQPPTQAGQGQAALMAILNKINQRLGK